MGNTYTQIHIQAIFAVAGRRSLIRPDWKEDLFKYISGVFRSQRQKLLAIGGVEDHIHLLFGARPNIAISDLIRDVKANSSAFVNENRLVRGRFNWQEGYGAFSYSKSQIDVVTRYVLNQERHHARRTFKDEYVMLLDRFEVDYDDRFLFEWIE
jgi:putative transposase